MAGFNQVVVVSLASVIFLTILGLCDAVLGNFDGTIMKCFYMHRVTFFLFVCVVKRSNHPSCFAHVHVGDVIIICLSGL